MGRLNLFSKSMAAVLVAVFFVSFSTGKIPEKLRVKIDSAVTEAYEIDAFEMAEIEIPASINKKTKVDFSPEHFFKLTSKGAFIGYLYLGEAPSMKNVFDYIVMFNKDLSIKKSKILIYREDFGRQIGSQRWLKQFIGLTPNDAVNYGETVDAISGATISAKSMTNEVKDLLQGIKVLKQERILK